MLTLLSWKNGQQLEAACAASGTWLPWKPGKNARARLAMMLQEMDHANQHNILATDIDMGALAIARAGGPYSAIDLRNVGVVQKLRYFNADGPPYFIDQAMRKLMP